MKKQPHEATSWDELKELGTFDEIMRALRAQETQRLAHKKYYLKRQAILAKAKELGIEG